MCVTRPLRPHAFDFFDIVKAGLAGILGDVNLRMCTPVDLNISIQMIASHVLSSSLGMGHQMLSDQALKQGRLEDALACAGDEGRSKLR